MADGNSNLLSATRPVCLARRIGQNYSYPNDESRDCSLVESVQPETDTSVFLGLTGKIAKPRGVRDTDAAHSREAASVDSIGAAPPIRMSDGARDNWVSGAETFHTRSPACPQRSKTYAFKLFNIWILTSPCANDTITIKVTRPGQYRLKVQNQ